MNENYVLVITFFNTFGRHPKFEANKYTTQNMSAFYGKLLKSLIHI